jgi:hypothetical protein
MLAVHVVVQACLNTRGDGEKEMGTWSYCGRYAYRIYYRTVRVITCQWWTWGNRRPAPEGWGARAPRR